MPKRGSGSIPNRDQQAHVAGVLFRRWDELAAAVLVQAEHAVLVVRGDLGPELLQAPGQVGMVFLREPALLKHLVAKAVEERQAALDFVEVARVLDPENLM